MNKRKMLIVSWDGKKDTGGVERVTQYMTRVWGTQYSIEIAQLSDLERNKIYRLFLHKHYAVDAVLMSLYVNGRIRKLGRNKVTVVTQGFNAPFVKADITFAHGTMRGMKIALEDEKAKWHFNQLFEKMAFRGAKQVVAVSGCVQDEVHRLYGVRREKIRVVNNCVDTDLFFPQQSVKNGVTVLFCGRLEKRKGVERLYELAKRIEAEQDMRLLIATPNSDNVQKFRKFRRTVVKVGLKTDDMNAFYNSGDIMYFPSLYEGYGLVITECLSAGVPVLSGVTGIVGEFCAKGQKGVAPIGKSVEDDIVCIRRLAAQFNDFAARESLHEDMVRNCGLESYSAQLKSLVDHA